MSNDSFLFIGMPSSNSMAVAKTVVNLVYAAQILRRNFALQIGGGTGIPAGRQFILKQVKEITGERSQRILWVDTDIEIEDAPARVAEAIAEADRRGVNFVSNYRTKLDGNLLYKNDTEKYTDEELDRAGDFGLRVAWGGLGFAYIDTPLDYVFHAEGETGEDRNFYRDLFSADHPYYAKVNLKHVKTSRF